MKKRKITAQLVICVAAALLSLNASAQSGATTSTGTGAAAHDEADTWDFRAQFTTAFQRKPNFSAAYSGTNSLRAAREQSRSTTATAYLGVRPWRDMELFFNPEMALGIPFSRLTGMGGFTNGEIAKTSGADPVWYRARLFGRQTWNLGERTEVLEADQNQLRDKVSAERLVFTLGNFSAIDIFDDNQYSHEPRRQFMNWSIMTHGAWDYPADARGYTWGAALEYISPTWSVRAGRFLQPRESNGLKLNYKIGVSYGDAVEVERAYVFAGQPGRVRALAFRNTAVMAVFQDAINLAIRSGSNPDIVLVRQRTSKTGYGASVEQALSASVGVFARASKHDGKSETYAFTEIDESFSGGVVAKGAAWSRPNDEIGVAVARNGISNTHREYLRRGGTAAFLGDGNLSYAPERIVEVYYSAAVYQNLWLSLGAQRINNPGYNAARGPATFYGIRLHTEF